LYYAVTTPPRPPSLERAEPLRTSVRADLRESTWWQRALLVLTAGWLAYEWGLGNETVTPWLLAKVIASTDGASSIVLTAAVGFVFTTSQQLASGITTAAGFAMFRRTAASAWVLLQLRLSRPPRPWSKLPLALRALLVFTLGTTAVVLIESSLTGEVGVIRHRRAIVQSAVLCGLMVAAIGAAGAALGWLGRSVDSLEPATHWVLRVLSNPLIWIALLAIMLTSNALRNRRLATAR
jgi:hypothetical protein